MTKKTVDQYETLEAEAPNTYGYYSALHFGEVGSRATYQMKADTFPTTLGEVDAFKLDSGAQISVSSNGFIFVELSGDDDYQRVVFPSRKARETKRGEHKYEDEKLKNGQNRQLARSFLRAHQAFIEAAVHATGSGGAVANSIDSYYDMTEVHAPGELLHRARVEQKWNADKRFTGLPWKVAHHAFQTLSQAEKAGGSDLLRLVELYQVSCRRFATHEYDQTISLCWIICEATMSKMWESHFRQVFKDTGREEEFSKTRIESLNRTPEQTKLEVLDAFGVIQSPLVQELKALRKTRNNVLHEFKQVTLRQAHEAVVCCKDLLFLAFQIRLTIMRSHPEGHGGRWLR